MPAHLDKTKTKEEAAVVSFPSDGSLIAAVFFGRKSTADTATRPSALLLSKSKSNDFVVVDFEFYLLRPELRYSASNSFIAVQCGTKRSTVYRNRVSNSIFSIVDFYLI